MENPLDPASLQMLAVIIAVLVGFGLYCVWPRKRS